MRDGSEAVEQVAFYGYDIWADQTKYWKIVIKDFFNTEMIEISEEEYRELKNDLR